VTCGEASRPPAVQRAERPGGGHSSRRGTRVSRSRSGVRMGRKAAYQEGDAAAWRGGGPLGGRRSPSFVRRGACRNPTGSRQLGLTSASTAAGGSRRLLGVTAMAAYADVSGRAPRPTTAGAAPYGPARGWSARSGATSSRARTCLAPLVLPGLIRSCFVSCESALRLRRRWYGHRAT